MSHVVARPASPTIDFYRLYPLLIGCVGTAVVVLVVGLYPLASDVHWFAIATRQWMDGAVLYRDLLETNPPMNFYLTRLSLGFGDVFGLNDIDAILTTAILVSMGSLCLSTVYIDRLASGERRYWLVTTIAFILFGLALPDFAQREHLFTALLLPYALACAVRSVGMQIGWKERTALAALLLPGLLLKPHFFLIPACLIVQRAIQTKDWRALFEAQNFVFLFGALGFAGYVWVVHQDYLTVILPMLIDGYTAYDKPLSVIINRSEVYVLVAFLLTALWLWRSANKTDRRILSVLLVGASAGFLSMLFQQKGFRYHYIPMTAFASIGMVWMLETIRHWPPVLRLAPLLPLVFALVFAPFAQIVHQRLDYRMLADMIGSRPAGERIAGISFTIGSNFPLTNATGMEWVGRWQHVWALPAAYLHLHYGTPRAEHYRPYYEYVRKSIVDDLVAGDPDYIVLNNSHIGMLEDDERLDWPGFLSRDPRFPSLWSEYQKLGSFDCEVIVIFARRSLGAAPFDSALPTSEAQCDSITEFQIASTGGNFVMNPMWVPEPAAAMAVGRSQ